jgi:hypothetical protein
MTAAKLEQFDHDCASTIKLVEVPLDHPHPTPK